MNALQNFAFEENLVRVVSRENGPWFVAADFCRILGIKQPSRAVEKLDDDEKGVTLIHTLGGNQELLTVSEGGLFTIILRSHAAITQGTVAHRFRKWVTAEVLPAIRRTGSYGSPRIETLEARPAMAEQIYALDLVKVALRMYGPARARLLWQDLGLPPVPEASDSVDPHEVLQTLMDYHTPHGLMCDMIDSRLSATLLDYGVRLDDGGFWLAQSHPAVLDAMRAYPRFWRTLLKLPGSLPSNGMKFGKRTSRAVFISRLAPI